METTTCRGHDRKTGQPCTAPSLGDTGLSAQHGGKAVEKALQTNTKHGLFARTLPQPLSDDFQTARTDPNAVGLGDEIALLRTFLARYLATFQDDQPVTADDLDRVARHVERISRLVVRQSRIRAEDPACVIREAMLAWTKQMTDVVQQVMREFLPEAHTCDAARRRFTELMAQQDPLDEEPVNDQSPLAGSPSLPRLRGARGQRGSEARGRGPGGRPVPSEERVCAVSAEAKLGDECLVGAGTQGPPSAWGLDSSRPGRDGGGVSSDPSQVYHFNLEEALRTARSAEIRHTLDTQKPAGHWPLLPDTRPTSSPNHTG